MSAEIHSSVKLTGAKTGQTVTSSASFSRDMTANGLMQATQLIGTAGEAIDFADLASGVACVQIKNLDATNFIELGLDSGVSAQKFAMVMPGESAQFQPATAVFFAKANTANVLVGVLACEL